MIRAAKSRIDCGGSCFHPIRKGWGWVGESESSERKRESREERERESFSIRSGRLEQGAQSCIRIPTCTLAYVENLRLRGGGPGDKAEAVRRTFLFIEGVGGSKGQGKIPNEYRLECFSKCFRRNAFYNLRQLSLAVSVFAPTPPSVQTRL